MFPAYMLLMSEREFVSRGCHKTHASRLDRWENVGTGLWVLFTEGTVTDLLGLTGGRSRFRRRSLRLVESSRPDSTEARYGAGEP